MATKVATNVPSGAHTAGIYADMTVDGPEIGTLVVIIDRAKNLPNRKSMGKQDPYCAARLGKEAKKTDTDKRGGQTPRWDQELRFTVHDSPDYYRLKVSVFNDDKKTELIGECWMSLDDIVVKGGGQRDLWQNLNCKGRYAGEIRIELTYYDTRPKESKNEESQQHQVEMLPKPSREGLSGPRQPKPVKRRPLPANPVETSIQSSVQQEPSATYHATSFQDGEHDTQDAFIPYNPHNDIHRNSYDQEELRTSHDISSRFRLPVQESNGFDRSSAMRHDSAPQHHHQIESQSLHQAHRGSLPDLAAVRHAEPMEDSDTYSQDWYSSAERTSPAPINMSQGIQRPQPLRPINGHVLPHSSPTVPTLQHQRTPPKHLDHEYGQAQHSSEFWTEIEDDVHETSTSAPPPPTHRHSTSGAVPEMVVYNEPQIYSAPPPQTFANGRATRSSISGSPLAQVHNVQPDHDVGQAYGHRTPQSQPRTTYPPARLGGQPTPSALIAGHQPRTSTGGSQRGLPESGNSIPGDTSPRPIYQHQDRPTDMSRFHTQPQFATNARPENRIHRNSAPIMPIIQGNADPRTPKRKSVSPQPESMSSERKHSEQPFSPDSFDVLNPNIGSAQSINHGGARYTTPEQAREAAIQSEMDAKRGDEPIIGSDGRVIDPSDHLPADTWAPEPESKTPKRGPEVTLRFKHSPHSTQSLPRAGRTPLAEARPNTMASPMHTQSAESSPTVAGRARLQKKSRVGMPQPNSSPIVPTLDATSPRPPAPRHYASDYPLRERENSPYTNHGSPTYGNRSPDGIPPPVPGKIPIDRGQEDWHDSSALSEELRSIDIGAGSGHRARVRRYGF